MAQRIRFYHFTVEGEYSFPFDMLRYDACYPNHGADASELTRRSKRKVQLISTVKPPTIERWASFGWTVSDIRTVS